MNDLEYFEKHTKAVIPDGVQTLSKMPEKHVKGVYPVYLDRAEGARVYSGRWSYIDYPCGLGAILLGYRYPEVDVAVTRQLGNGCLFSLPNKLETKLAEKICQLIPSAEMCRFLKTGSEATSAAVKIARAVTGKMGIACCGYHGWSSWYSATTSKKKGTPDVYRELAGQFKYNDMESLERIFSLSEGVHSEIGAVIVEPYIYDEPKDNFLNRVIELAHSQGALVIFDEIVTGFRTKEFSAQKMFGVTPDLTCLGKAMANGLPISVVCGKKEFMKELEGSCFVSSTFGGELLSIAAALATIEVLETEPVIDHIWSMGQRLKDGFNELTRTVKGVECIGYPPRTYFKFRTEAQKSLFWQECIKRGVLFGYAQFINYSHKQKEIDYTLKVIEKALDKVWFNFDEPEKVLEGPVARETFRLISTR